MKKVNLAGLMFVILLFALSFVTIKAQNGQMPAADAPEQNFAAPRPNLMRQLGLTQDQVRIIQQINQEKKPQMREAQERLREANRSLDQAIYADAANETEIQARLREVISLHAEVVKIRTATELAVRRVLTPEQLAKFRDVRLNFMERKENMQRQMKNRRMSAPNRSPNNRRSAPLRRNN